MRTLLIAAALAACVAVPAHAKTKLVWYTATHTGVDIYLIDEHDPKRCGGDQKVALLRTADDRAVSGCWFALSDTFMLILPGGQVERLAMSRFTWTRINDDKKGGR